MDTTEPTRVGVILAAMPARVSRTLRYLILHLNTIQNTFEFEFPPVPADSGFLSQLDGNHTVSRKPIVQSAPAFIAGVVKELEKQNRAYELVEPPPSRFAILSMARFADEYYSTTSGNVAIIAFGNWKRVMAPPTIVEFFLTSLIRDVTFFIAPSVGGRVHLGTKSCLFDFTPELADARYKVLNAFVCSGCRGALIADGHESFLAELRVMLRREWFGKRDDPTSPAAVSAKLGHDLFLTKGLRRTPSELALSALGPEAVKFLFVLIGGVVLAALLYWFGLRGVD